MVVIIILLFLLGLGHIGGSQRCQIGLKTVLYLYGIIGYAEINVIGFPDIELLLQYVLVHQDGQAVIEGLSVVDPDHPEGNLVGFDIQCYGIADLLIDLVRNLGGENDHISFCFFKLLIAFIL